MKKYQSVFRLLGLAASIAFVVSFAKGTRLLAAPSFSSAVKAAPQPKTDSRRLWPALWNEMSAQLSTMPEVTNDTRPALPPRLKSLIESSQPQAGDILLAILAEPENPLYRKATNAFVRSWNTMTAEQIEAYFQNALVFKASPRPTYPQGVEAEIRLEYQMARGPSGSVGWNAWPLEDEMGFKSEDFKTWTTIFLDGQQRGDPFYFYGPGATVGWISTQKLDVGTHSISMTLRYEYSLHGEKRSGQVSSSDFAFEIVPSVTNELAVVPSPQLDALVLSNLRFAETEEFFDSPWRRRMLTENTDSDAWDPTETYSEGGAEYRLHLPAWRLIKPLPVDLCFEVTMQVEGRRDSYHAGQLVVLRGETFGTYFTLREESRFIATSQKNRWTLVPVRFVLKPSRTVALTDPGVTGYYSHTLTTGVMRLKISYR